jgi:predicted aspartyl protease
MLDGKPVRAMVDTGAPATLIGQATALGDFQADMHQNNVDNSTAGTMTGASDGEIDAVPHRFATLQLGGINIRNPVLLIASSDKAWRGDYAGLLLGMRDLRNFHLYIAYQERKLYLSRANATAADHAPAPRP